MKITVVGCLIFFSLVVQAQRQLSKGEYDSVTEQYKVEFREASKLKHQLIILFVTNRGFNYPDIEQLKQRFDISDGLMRSVATEIYTESAVAVKEKRTDGIDGGLDAYRQQVVGALFCLGLSADPSAKQLLMSIALDDKEEMSFRQQAISAYLRAADPEEAKNALIRFLVEGDRMDSQGRSSICDYARTIFKGASQEKRASILEALYVALSREDNKWLFRVYDDILCKISKEYANSHQRQAILKRLINAPSLCKADDYAMPELQEKLKEIQKMRLYTNISTNIVTLKGRNFNLPLPLSVTNELNGTTTESADTNAGVEKSQATNKYSMGVLSLIGGATILILGLVFWRFARWR